MHFKLIVISDEWLTLLEEYRISNKTEFIVKKDIPTVEKEMYDIWTRLSPSDKHSTTVSELVKEYWEYSGFEVNENNQVGYWHNPHGNYDCYTIGGQYAASLHLKPGKYDRSHVIYNSGIFDETGVKYNFGHLTDQAQIKDIDFPKSNLLSDSILLDSGWFDVHPLKPEIYKYLNTEEINMNTLITVIECHI